MSMIERSCRRWKLSIRAISVLVRPQVPLLYVSTGMMYASYSRSLRRSLILPRRNQIRYMDRNAQPASSCLSLAASSASPSKEPSFLTDLHTSSFRSGFLDTSAYSVFEALMFRYHLPRMVGAMASTSRR